MDIDIAIVPYDSGQRGFRMGAGPEELLRLGLATALENDGHRVTTTVIEVGAEVVPEISAGFKIATSVAEFVASALAAARLPVIFSGNCIASLGVVAALGPRAVVAWCDAHADFNTPETTTSGFLDGMSLAITTGRCWRQLAQSIPGFAPLRDDAVWLIGARDIDPQEVDALDRSGFHRIAADRVGEALCGEISARTPPEAAIHLHIDADVLDPAVGRANQFATTGGTTAKRLSSFGRCLRPATVTISAYDPAVDTDGRVGAALVAIVRAIAGSGNGE